MRVKTRAMGMVSSAVIVLAACGGGSSDTSGSGSPATTATTADAADTTTETTTVVTSAATPATTTPPTTQSPPEAVADAILIEPAVDLRPVSATAFSPLDDPQPVGVGDVVRTDRTGFAEIAYFDGSRTRLDVDTEFEVLELVDDVDAATVRTRMGVGRTWHRVERLGESGSFSVETSVATAVVQGTAFAIECGPVAPAPSCTFSVLEGELAIRLPDGSEVALVAPASLTVGDEPQDPLPLPWDAAFRDAWLLDNAARDAEVGFASAAEIFEEHGPAFASMAGSYVGTRTITSITCSTYCIDGDATEADVGFSDELTLDLRSECDDAGCAPVGNAGIPYAFDGASYSATIPTADEPGAGDCSYVPDDGSTPQVTGSTSQVFDVVLTPTDATVRDGVYVVTSLRYDAVVTVDVEGHCAVADSVVDFAEYLALPPYGGYIGVWSGSVER